MINTNTNRWQSVRLLFDKHIIGGNLKSNYKWQQSVGVDEEAEPLQQDEDVGVVGATLTLFCLVSWTGALNGTLTGRQSSVQIHIKTSSSGLG